jgi:hypothetical protein
VRDLERISGIQFKATAPPTPECVAKASAAMATDQISRVAPEVSEQPAAVVSTPVATIFVS